MTARSNVARKWKPNLEAIDEISRACRLGRPPTIEDYAKKAGASSDELLKWIAKITRALKAKPHALSCIRHLIDLRRPASGLSAGQR
jgi:hypothetical protein